MSKTIIAIPMENGVLCAHFGHCEYFSVVTVEDVKSVVEEVKEEPIVVVEESQKTVVIEDIPVVEEVKEELKPKKDTKDLEEIKRLREKLNNGTISDGEAAMLFELLKD